MTVTGADPAPDPDPDRELGQDPLPEWVPPELAPIPDVDGPAPEWVPPELAVVPLPEPDIAAVIASLAREADDLQRFVAELAAREDDPAYWPAVLAELAERDAELARWSAVLP